MPISLTIDLRTPNGGFFGTDDGGVPGGALVSFRYDRDVRETNGTVPAPAQGRPVVISGATDPVVTVPYANDDAAVSDDSQGFAIIVGARWRQGTQVVSWSKTVAIDSSYGSAVSLRALPGAQPVPPQYMTVTGVLAVANQAVSDAQAAETSAASSATSAAASAALVGAPAGSAIDAHLGGDSTTVVTDVTALKGQVVNLAAHVAPNTGADITAAVQAFVNTLSDGDELLIGKGTWRVDGTLTFAQNNLTVRLRQGALIDRTLGTATPSWAASATYSVGSVVRSNNYSLQCTVGGTTGTTAPTPPTTLNATVVDGGVTWKRIIAPEAASCFVFTGTGATLKGRGSIKSAAVWDGLNAQWTDAVVKFTGDTPTCRDLTLTGIPRVGVGFSNCNGVARVEDVNITGNYPQVQWTEFETGHFGIAYDPGTIKARLITRGVAVDSCVQGEFLGNYGAGSSSGSSITASSFTGCWNHGIYNAGGLTDCIITSNSFVDCSREIVMSDSGHIVAKNQLKTSGTGGTLNAASINMRNAVDCTVEGNNITGDVWTGSAVIDFNHVSGGTVCTGNACRGNRINMTGVNAGYAIRMGTTATATWANNTVEGNIVNGAGTASSGLISLFSAGSGTGVGGKVKGNTVTVTGNSYGMYGYNLIGAQFEGNTYINQFNASSAIVVGGIVFAGTCTGCETKHNQFITQAAYGANTTLRCIWENGGGVTAGRMSGNAFTLLATTMTNQSTHYLGVGGPVIDEVLTGAPAFTAGPGSQVRRSDGAAGSTLYVKSSASNLATWTAIA